MPSRSFFIRVLIWCLTVLRVWGRGLSLFRLILHFYCKWCFTVSYASTDRGVGWDFPGSVCECGGGWVIHRIQRMCKAGTCSFPEGSPTTTMVDLLCNVCGRGARLIHSGIAQRECRCWALRTLICKCWATCCYVELAMVRYTMCLNEPEPHINTSAALPSNSTKKSPLLCRIYASIACLIQKSHQIYAATELWMCCGYARNTSQTTPPPGGELLP